MTHRGDCFLVPGPVRMNQTCLDAMATPVITARGPEFREVMASLNSGLRLAFNLSPSQPHAKHQSWAGEDDYVVIVVSGSGTAAMEMVISNRYSPEHKVLVPTNGKFGERVAEMCERYCQPNHLRYEWGQAFDYEHINSLLGSGEYESLLICHNETSAGITQDAARLARMCEEHGVSFILDGITSVGGLPVHPAEWNAEAVVVGAQKCTAGPSGIAAIAVKTSFIDRVKSLRTEGKANPCYYLDLLAAAKKGDDDQTPWTPAINLAMGWSAALQVLKNEGLSQRWERCEHLAQGVRRLFLDLGFTLLADESHRSNTVTAIMYPEGIDDTWRSTLKSNHQTQVIGAQDHLKGKMFRIGSMGETTVEEMIEGCQRMITCFNEFGYETPDVDVASYFR